LVSYRFGRCSLTAKSHEPSSGITSHTDDFVDPAHLGPIARLGLKEAFRIVGGEQQMLATELGVDR
jgi:hypothetical protein